MEADWYYEENGQVTGPVSFDSIVARIKRNLRSPDLVWTEGMTDWMEANAVPALAPLFRAAPPPLPVHIPGRPEAVPSVALDRLSLDPIASGALHNQPEITHTVGVSSAIQTHPWRRYFARMFDLYSFFVVAGVLLGIFVPSLFAGSSKNEDQLLGLVFIVAFVPVEAFLLYAFGTTLGKLIYGISLPTHLSFSKAFRRSVLVWYRGLGLGIPIVTLCTLNAAYRNLKKAGKTTWDAELGCDMAHAPFSVMRWVAVVGCWAGLTFISVVLISLDKGV